MVDTLDPKYRPGSIVHIFACTDDEVIYDSFQFTTSSDKHRNAAGYQVYHPFLEVLRGATQTLSPFGACAVEV